MKQSTTFIPIILIVILLAGCGNLTNTDTKVITPSDKIISENRSVSGFNAIEFSTLGKMNIIQGATESLNISGPDNLVPEIVTEVKGQTLIVRSKGDISVTNLNSGNMLTFTIVVKELTSLTTSGLGDTQVDMLTTPSMAVTMSGAGQMQFNQFVADEFNLTLSGLGGISLTGETKHASVDLSGAGSVNAPDFKIQEANVTVSGLGGATVWVTDQLTGEISSSGSVNYFGSPKTSLNSSSLGSFKSLGSK